LTLGTESKIHTIGLTDIWSGQDNNSNFDKLFW